MEAMLFIVEPRMKSLEIMRRIIKLASGFEIKEVIAVGNKISNENERLFV